MNNELMPFDNDLPENNQFTSDDFSSLQIRLLEFLACHIVKYTSGDSSSVPQEIAQELLDSICFTLGIDKDAEPSIPKELLHIDVHEQYKRGFETIERKIEDGKKL